MQRLQCGFNLRLKLFRIQFVIEIHAMPTLSLMMFLRLMSIDVLKAWWAYCIDRECFSPIAIWRGERVLSNATPMWTCAKTGADDAAAAGAPTPPSA